MSEETFLNYDAGFRCGTFDKCNGRPCAIADNGGEGIWEGGYLDGWNGNEAKINEPTEEELAERAYEAGSKYAREDAEARRHAAMVHGDLSDQWWDGFYDNA